MSIRDRIQDTMLLLHAGRPAGALLSLLAAVSATSRRRYPRSLPSRRHPGKRMGDGEAFEAFLADEMIRIWGASKFHVHFRGGVHPLEHVLYKWFRCELAHTAALPSDVQLVDGPDFPGMSIYIDPHAGLRLGMGWFGGIAGVVVHAPENRDQFGDPPSFPVPFVFRIGDQEITIDATPSEP